MVSTFVGMMGAGLRPCQRFSIFTATSVLLPLLALLLARYVVHAFDGHFWLVWLISGPPASPSGAW